MPETASVNDRFADVSLHLVEGPGKGARFRLRGGRNVIGRAGEVVLNDDSVSRSHACITIDDSIMLEDMGSGAGTVLNGHIIVKGAYIFDKDLISIGPFGLRLSVTPREDRQGVVTAFLVLFAAAAIFFAALFVRQWSREADEALVRSTGGADAGADNMTVLYAAWKDWGSATLPSRADLLEEDVEITAEAAESEYILGFELYQDRLVEHGNSYKALLHFKKCLAILSFLPLEERPALARRAIDYLTELQGAIRSNCDDRVFAYIRSFQMQYWTGCLQSLNEIRSFSPVAESPYNKWARERIEELNRIIYK